MNATNNSTTDGKDMPGMKYLIVVVALLLAAIPFLSSGCSCESDMFGRAGAQDMGTRTVYLPPTPVDAGTPKPNAAPGAKLQGEVFGSAGSKTAVVYTTTDEDTITSIAAAHPLTAKTAVQYLNYKVLLKYMNAMCDGRSEPVADKKDDYDPLAGGNSSDEQPRVQTVGYQAINIDERAHSTHDDTTPADSSTERGYCKSPYDTLIGGMELQLPPTYVSAEVDQRVNSWMGETKVALIVRMVDPSKQLVAHMYEYLAAFAKYRKVITLIPYTDEEVRLLVDGSETVFPVGSEDPDAVRTAFAKAQSMADAGTVVFLADMLDPEDVPPNFEELKEELHADYPRLIAHCLKDKGKRCEKAFKLKRSSDKGDMYY